jgi:mannose-6-phosphate isomerase-like protein (cupin superfamily)
MFGGRLNCRAKIGKLHACRCTGEQQHPQAMEVVNLASKFEMIHDYWKPHIVGELNGQHVKLAKLHGEFIWHHHLEEDEMFFVVKGDLLLKMEEGDVTVSQGEFFVMPKGVNHLPVAKEEVWLMLFEPAGTLNTGNVQHDMTIADPDRL